MNPAITGPELRRWRKNAGLTQEELGRKLGVTREWIGQLESSDRPISASIFLKLDGLKREQKFASTDTPDPGDGVSEQPQTAYGSPETLRSEIRELLEKTLLAAGDDVARLGWVREQALRHITAPEHWDIHEQVIKKVLEDERKAESAAHAQSARAQGKAS